MRYAESYLLVQVIIFLRTCRGAFPKPVIYFTDDFCLWQRSYAKYIYRLYYDPVVGRFANADDAEIATISGTALLKLATKYLLMNSWVASRMPRIFLT